MGKATQDLRKEHDIILHVLYISDNIISSEKEDVKLMHFGKELVYFLKTFGDKCHHGKEENHLFKELEKQGIPNAGGPIGAMLQEHQEGRTYISLMDQAVGTKDAKNFKINTGNYNQLLRSHIEKENNVLFVMADQILDDAKQDILFEKFQQHEENVIGHGVHEELHSMIHKWTKEFEVH